MFAAWTLATLAGRNPLKVFFATLDSDGSVFTARTVITIQATTIT